MLCWEPWPASRRPRRAASASPLETLQRHPARLPAEELQGLRHGSAGADWKPGSATSAGNACGRRRGSTDARGEGISNANGKAYRHRPAVFIKGAIRSPWLPGFKLLYSIRSLYKHSVSECQSNRAAQKQKRPGAFRSGPHISSTVHHPSSKLGSHRRARPTPAIFRGARF